MFSPARQIRHRSHSLALVAVLALGWLSSPVALSLQAEDVCGSPCCVNAGHCCCVSHHARVEGQRSDGKGMVGTPIASSRCPDGCGNGSVSTQLPSRDIESHPGTSLVFGAAEDRLAESFGLFVESVRFNSFTPRAPPTSLA
jgi:hypothetical protein